MNIVRLRRAATPGLLIASLLSVAGCRFSFDRNVSPGEIRGTVVMTPSPGASLVPVTGARITLENSSVTVTADAHGRFVMTQLPAGTYAVDLVAPPGDAGVTRVGLHLSGITLAAVSGGLGDGEDLGQVVLGAYGGIAGTVTSSGEPLNGAFAVLPNFASITTANGGAYAFANLLPGNYALSVVAAAAPGAARIVPPQQVIVKPGAITTVPTIDVPLMPVVTQGGVQGRVVLLGAASSRSATILLTGTSTRISPTDDGGDYLQAGIPAYVYSLMASAPGFKTATIQGVIVGGATTQLPIITLSPGTNPAAPAATLSGSFSARSPGYHMVLQAGRSQPAEHSPSYSVVPDQVALMTADGGTL